MKTLKAMVLIGFVSATVCAAWADTVYLQSGREEKGIVVEEYKDRIVLSTPDGEKMIKRAEISSIGYDEIDQNFVALAEQYRRRGDNDRALQYYRRALAANPDSKQIRDMVALLSRSLFKQDGMRKQRHVNQMAMIEKWRTYQSQVNEAAQHALTDKPSAEDQIYAVLGFNVEKSPDGNFVARNVRRGSAASQAGVRDGDLIVAVWGRLTGYLELDEFIELLLKAGHEELRVQVQREAVVPKQEATMLGGYEDRIGAALQINLDGLTVGAVVPGGPAQEHGLAEGDLITRVEGEQTRYLPLAQVVDIVKDEKRTQVRFTFRRELVIWR